MSLLSCNLLKTEKRMSILKNSFFTPLFIKGDVFFARHKKRPRHHFKHLGRGCYLVFYLASIDTGLSSNIPESLSKFSTSALILILLPRAIKSGKSKPLNPRS